MNRDVFDVRVGNKTYSVEAFYKWQPATMVPYGSTWVPLDEAGYEINDLKIVAIYRDGKTHKPRFNINEYYAEPRINKSKQRTAKIENLFDQLAEKIVDQIDK